MQKGILCEIIPVNLGMVNAFILKGEKGSLLIDCGIPGSDKKILAAFKAHGVDDLSLMVFTHGHADHMGAASALRSVTGAKSMIHTLDAEAIRTGKNPPVHPTNAKGRLFSRLVGQDIKGFLPYEPEFIISGETSLEEYGIAGRVIMTPGHTPGSVSVMLNGGAIFVGDAIMGGMAGKGRPNLPMYADDVDMARQSIKNIVALSPRIVYTGHGGPFAAGEIRG